MSSIREFVESRYGRDVAELVGCTEFVALETGTAERTEYDRFVARVFETHQESPHFVAFLLAVSPPGSVERLTHNLFEELGVAEEGAESHPALLDALLTGAGLADQAELLRRRARESLAARIAEPLLYPSLREQGLAALVEIVGFEHMLSRVASRIAVFLETHRSLPAASLVWFTHHSEVDIAHAAEGLDTIVEYVEHYGFVNEEARDIVEATLRENVFIKRYFGRAALARVRGMA